MTPVETKTFGCLIASRMEVLENNPPWNYLTLDGDVIMEDSPDLDPYPLKSFDPEDI